MLEAINVRSVFGERFANRFAPAAPDYDIETARADTDLDSNPNIFQGIVLPFLAAVSLSLLFVSGLIYFWGALTAIGNWGYLSIFFVELANSATVFVPTPGQAFSFSMGSTLNPFYIGLIGGVGSAMGEFTGYALGARTGNRIKCGRLFRRLDALTNNWGGLYLFMLAIVPAPFEIAGVWAGAVRYSKVRFFIYVFLGKMIKITGFALAGYFSISKLLG
ncbi:MAG: VTT domain-containing protein [Chloroflexi bacterium]|nr:VTT domain-containing protein [Chloroflexota bacterium]